MKRCFRCKQEKEETEFAKNKSKKDGLQTMCKECKRKYDNDKYKQNPKLQLERNADHRRRLVNKMREYKESHGCKYCGEKRPECLDFHHTDNKKDNLANMASKGCTKKMIDEMKKCIVICSNCHRLLHAGKL